MGELDSLVKLNAAEVERAKGKISADEVKARKDIIESLSTGEHESVLPFAAASLGCVMTTPRSPRLICASRRVSRLVQACDGVF